MNTSQITKIIKALEKEVGSYDAPVVELTQVQTKNPFKVLIAALLSARTNDKITIVVLKKLFSEVDAPDDLSRLDVSDIEKLIYPAGFYRNKAKYLKRLPLVLQREFNGEIPDRIEDLLKLPGVGRKTANLVRSVAFGKPAVCVDVHVHRIMNRLGFVKTKTPLETEMALRKKLPRKYWIRINFLLVAHGQNICRPINPHCDQCVVSGYCIKAGVSSSRRGAGKRREV